MVFLLNGYPLIRMPSPWHPTEQLRDIRPVAVGQRVVAGEGAGLALVPDLSIRKVFFCVLRSGTSATGFVDCPIATGTDAEGYADGYIRHSHEEGAGTNEANPNVSILAIRWMLY